MSMGWSDLTPEGKRYFAELEKLSRRKVKVGFQSDQAYEDGTTLPQVAAYNELGTSDMPARPFMKQSFENHGDELQAACDDVNATISNGGSCEDGLNRLGVFLVGLVQDEIVEGGFAPNAPSTVKKKGSAQPLIDTSTMRGSVKFVIE